MYNIHQDRYRELLRISRQWRDLQHRKRAGFGHHKDLASLNTPGSLAIFCPACPQPGLNLPEGWDTMPDPWRFRRVYNVDGCFKADHFAIHTPNDVFLSDGLLFCVGYPQYRQHLLTANEVQEVSCCLPISGRLSSLHRNQGVAITRL